MSGAGQMSTPYVDPSLRPGYVPPPPVRPLRRMTAYEKRHCEQLLLDICRQCRDRRQPLPTYYELAWRLGLAAGDRSVQRVYVLLQTLKARYRLVLERDRYGMWVRALMA